MTITWYEFGDEREEETANKLMAYIGKYESHSSDEDMTDEELAETFRLLYTKWNESCITLKKKKKTISVLHKEKEKHVSTITSLEDEISLLNAKLESIPEHVQMINNNYEELDDILEENNKVAGFDYSFLRKKFSQPKKNIDFMMLNHMPKPPARHMYPKCRGFKNTAKRCHHCGKYGHIRPFCYSFVGYPKFYN